jgi:hypothetical protein
LEATQGKFAMTHKIFYSWQTDTPARDCRSLIERSLNRAIELLGQDLSIDKAIREGGLALDKDTKGVAGSPPIVETIFRKIDASAVFVADVTFVGKRLDGRPTPNPNVLLEYGWALKSRGYQRIICVMNTAYGEPTDQTLPFNMKHLRWPIRYCLPADAETSKRAEVLAELTDDLSKALRSVVEHDEFLAYIPPPQELPKFEAMQPVAGSARFRAPDQPLGMVELGFDTGAGHEVRLTNGAALWLRVMPVAKLQRQWSISELRQTMSRAGLSVLPLGNYGSSWSFVRGPDGFGYVPSTPGEATHVPAVSYAFRSGEIWTVYAGPFATQEHFQNIEGMFYERFADCVRFMRDGLGISLPFRWIAGIEGGIKGKRMQRFAPPGRAFITPYTRPCLEEVVTETGVYTAADKAQLALKPFFLKLYDACGEERGEHMDTALFALPDP